MSKIRQEEMGKVFITTDGRKFWGKNAESRSVAHQKDIESAKAYKKVQFDNFRKTPSEAYNDICASLNMDPQKEKMFLSKIKECFYSFKNPLIKAALGKNIHTVNFYDIIRPLIELSYSYPKECHTVFQEMIYLIDNRWKPEEEDDCPGT